MEPSKLDKKYLTMEVQNFEGVVHYVILQFIKLLTLTTLQVTWSVPCWTWVQERPRQKNDKFKDRLAYTVKPCLKVKK